MGHDRRKHERESCEGKAVLRPVGPAGAENHVLDLYLRDKSTGGISGTCFENHPPRVNDMYSVLDQCKGQLKLRVAWTASAVERVHMVGLQYVRGPVAT